MTAFALILDPHEDGGVDSLWAGKAAPDAPNHGSCKKQQQRTDDQQTGQVDEILRKQHGTKQVKALGLKVKQHGLTRAPVQPWNAIKEGLGQPDHDPTPS